MSIHKLITQNSKEENKQLDFKNFIIKNKTLKVRGLQRIFNTQVRQNTFGCSTEREQNQIKLPSLPPYDICYHQVDRHQRTFAIKNVQKFVNQNHSDFDNSIMYRKEEIPQKRKASLSIHDIQVKIQKTDLLKPQNYFDFQIQKPLNLKELNNIYDNLKEKYNIKTSKTSNLEYPAYV